MKKVFGMLLMMTPLFGITQDLQTVTQNGNATTLGINVGGASSIFGLNFNLPNSYTKQIVPTGYNFWLSTGAEDGRLMMPYNNAENARFQNLGLVIDNNVGIGTTSPLNKLHVNGILRWGSESSKSIYSGIDAQGAYIEQVGQDVAESKMRFQTSRSGDAINYSRLMIDPENGFLFQKIGTANGNIKLVDPLAGYLINYASLSESKGGASTILGNNVMSGTAANTVKKTVNPYDAGSFISLNYTFGITFHTGITSGLNTDVAVEDSEKMRITPSGNLLVGKISQANAIYKLDVNGKVRANEVVVNTTGADFVFDNNYKLLPLAEVERFIQKNKHLPEIANAKTMQTEGVGVSELQTKLLQKVEELTLYLIQKDKELSKEKEKNKLLDERVTKLEELIKLKK